MRHVPSLNQPVIFLGPPRSGVTLVSDIIFYHEAFCWLDERFNKHPKSGLEHRLFRHKCQCRNNALNIHSFLGDLVREFSPSPSEATHFWDENTRDEIDFYRGFARGKHATPLEISTLRNILCKRVALSQKSRLALKFTGPARLCFLHSLFPDAKFIYISRDPASTVHSMLSTEEWEYQGKHLLWWRGAYSLKELAQYDQLRGHPVAGTAFQLNKLLQTAKREASELDLDVLTIQYEDFVSAPDQTIARVLDFAELPASETVNAALRQNNIRCSNNVLRMPATDVNTVYTWCPAY